MNNGSNTVRSIEAWVKGKGFYIRRLYIGTVENPGLEHCACMHILALECNSERDN